MPSVAEKISFETNHLTPRIASEVMMDRDQLLSGQCSDALRLLLVERGVLVFRKVDLSAEELAAFARTLGPIVAESGIEVLTMSFNEKDTRVAAYLRSTQFWHIDNLGRGMPNFASMLSAIEVPPTGGETEFANTYAAWDGLRETEKAELDGLIARHSFEHAQRKANPDPSDEQVRQWRSLGSSEVPLVWHHRSGRASLALSTDAFEVVGMEPADGQALLARIEAHATRPEYVYRHNWSAGDLVVWDNTGTLHRGRPFPEGAPRRMLRVATAGFEPVC